jgi:phospholipid/cholesterol/gamma-HCH transport system ATP-binding protein
MITHDLDLLWQVADRVAVLAEGKVQGIGSMSELSHMDHPAIRQFFDGPRGRAAQEQAYVSDKRQADVQTDMKNEKRPSKPK